MKRGFLFVSFIPALVFLGGCAQTLTKTGPLEMPDSYFRPQRVYAVELNQAWDLTLKALSREGISLELVSKETGLIRTDYQNPSPWERDQCDLRFSPEPQGKTFIYVRCRYEGRKEATDPFRDFTYSSSQRAMKAEEGIYRRIEPYILAFERTPMPNGELVAKAPPKADLPPAVPTPSAKPEAASPPTPAAPTEGQLQAAVVPALKIEPPAPQPEAVSPPTPSPVAEVKPPPATGSPVMEAPSSKPEAASPSGLPERVSPKKPEIVEEPKVHLTAIESANVRLAPSTQSKIIAVLGKGKRVERVGESGPWTKIKLPSGDTAWIFGAFVQEVPPEEGISAAQPTQTRGLSSLPPAPEAKEASPPPAAKDGKAVKGGLDEASKIFLVTKAIAKMKSDPSPTAKVVLVLKRGREVEKIGESGNFTKVRLSWGDTGWVLTRFLEKAR